MKNIKLRFINKLTIERMSIKDVKCNEMSDILESLKAKNRIHNSGFD